MLELTNTAIDYILKESMEMLDPAIRVGITNGGCGGSEYILEFADEINEDDHILDFEKFIIVIDQDSKPDQARIQLSHLNLPKTTHLSTIFTNPTSNVRKPKEQ